MKYRVKYTILKKKKIINITAQTGSKPKDRIHLGLYTSAIVYVIYDDV